MQASEIETVTLNVCDIVKAIASYIASQAHQNASIAIRTKAMHDFVTTVDQESEKMLIEALGRLMPEAGFLVEEHSVENEPKEFQWVIDPLDGTTNFIHGIPVYAISVALQQHSSTVLGVVYEINRDECFYSWKGADAFLNGNKINVSQEYDLHRSLFATGFPYNDFSRLEPYTLFLKNLMKNSAGIRRIGSASVDLAYVACGRFEGFYEYALHAWDIAAGAFLVEQAGGIVTDFKGHGAYHDGHEIIATNRNIRNVFMELFSKHF